MAFNDLPTVDDSSMNSEGSVLAVKSYFSQKNGFISRTEVPDFGCDLDVELIVASNKASGKKFPIQIKSEQSITFISKDDREYISKSFKTSRLNYLCNRSPAYGLIIIYDDITQICYYDFVEKIVARINDEKNGLQWKGQKTVTIHIPKESVLTNESVNIIYDVFLKRFEAHDLLIDKHGQDFEIPSFGFDEKDKSSIDRLSTVEMIKKYGLFFINSYDIAIVHNMLIEVPFQEIITSKELILVAVIVYSEIGKSIEAEFYLSKANQILNQYDESEKEIIKFSQIKVDFLLGKRSSDDYYKDLKSLKEITKNKYNEVQININLLYYSILEQVRKNEFDESLESTIMDTFKAIADLDLDESKKHLFNVYHSENLHMYISSWMLKKVSSIRLRDALNVHVDIQERVSALKKANEFINSALSFVLKAWEFGKKKPDKLVEAHALFAMGRFFFTKEYDFLLLGFKDNQTDVQVNFKRSFLQSLKSHNLFLELGYLKEARLSLINAYELNRLAKLYHQFDITVDSVSEEVIINNLRASEQTMGIKNPYQSIVDSAFETHIEINSQDEDERFANMNDDEIDQYAKVVHRTYGLPQERLMNIVNEMKALRYFYSKCDRENYQILFDLRHMRSIQTKYASPIFFILINKRTGLKSLPGVDIEKLASDFGAIKK